MSTSSLLCAGKALLCAETYVCVCGVLMHTVNQRYCLHTVCTRIHLTTWSYSHSHLYKHVFAPPQSRTPLQAYIRPVYSHVSLQAYTHLHSHIHLYKHTRTSTATYISTSIHAPPQSSGLQAIHSSLLDQQHHWPQLDPDWCLLCRCLWPTKFWTRFHGRMNMTIYAWMYVCMGVHMQIDPDWFLLQEL